MSEARALTGGEIALAGHVFPRQLPWERIRLIRGGGRNPVARAALVRQGVWAITLGRSIYFRPEHYRPDFAPAGERDRALLVHELVHVWQYLTLGTPRFLGRYAAEFAGCGFSAMRMYDYRGAAHFDESGLEAQAQMVGDYLLLRGRPGSEALAAKLAGTGFHGL